MQSLENKCRILSDLWVHHKDEEKEEDFIEDYDLYELIRYGLRSAVGTFCAS